MFGKVVYYPKTWKSVINMTSFRRFGYGTVSFIGKKELEDKIASNDMRLEKEKSKLDAIPTMNGFANVAAFKKALKKAKADLTAKEKLQEEWRRPDPKPKAAYWCIPANVKREPVQEQRPEEKKSAEKRGIKERLAEKKMEIEQQSPKPKKRKTIERDCL